MKTAEEDKELDILVRQKLSDLYEWMHGERDELFEIHPVIAYEDLIGFMEDNFEGVTHDAYDVDFNGFNHDFSTFFDTKECGRFMVWGSLIQGGFNIELDE